MVPCNSACFISDNRVHFTRLYWDTFDNSSWWLHTVAHHANMAHPVGTNECTDIDAQVISYSNHSSLPDTCWSTDNVGHVWPARALQLHNAILDLIWVPPMVTGYRGRCGTLLPVQDTSLKLCATNLLLVFVSWTLICQPQNSVFIHRV